MENKECSRRKFFSKCLGTSSILLSGGLIFNSCDSNKTPVETKQETSSKNACSDLSGVSEGEKVKRQKLAYVDKSPVSESYCGNCSMYIPQGQDKQCGGCILFKGPVYSSGYCIQYVTKV